MGICWCAGATAHSHGFTAWPRAMIARACYKGGYGKLSKPRGKDLMQTVDRIVEVLEEAGIDHVFGIPGGDTGRIYKALYHKQDKIKVVVARDEQTAACMAEMYGRLTG